MSSPVVIRPHFQSQTHARIVLSPTVGARIGRDRRFPVFVVAFPLAAQYDAAYLAKDRDYVLKPQRKLREICERLGIAFYDIYPDLTARHFVADGVHLTPEGRRVAGAHIASFLVKSGLLRP